MRHGGRIETVIEAVYEENGLVVKSGDMGVASM